MAQKKTDLEKLVKDICIVLAIGLGSVLIVHWLIELVASSPIQHW